jgi:hypothetical protein
MRILFLTQLFPYPLDAGAQGAGVSHAAASFDRLKRGSFDRLKRGSFDRLKRGSFDRLKRGSFDRLKRGSFDRLKRGSFGSARSAAGLVRMARRSAGGAGAPGTVS